MTSKSLKDKNEEIVHVSPDKFANDVLRCHNVYRYKHCSVIYGIIIIINYGNYTMPDVASCCCHVCLVSLFYCAVL